MSCARADREVVLTAVGNGDWALQWASNELRADREVVLKAVAQYGSALLYASEELRADRQVVLADASALGYRTPITSRRWSTPRRS